MELITQCAICQSDFLRSRKSRRSTCSKICEYKLKAKTKQAGNYSEIEKICSDCEQSFLDKTKRKLSVRCKSCIHAKMVATRRQNGSYERSDAQNEKLSNTLREKYSQGWNQKSPELRQKLSSDLKRRWQDGSMAQKTATTCVEKYGVVHWTKTDIAKKQISDRKKGKKLSKDSCSKMSFAAANRIRENKNHFQRGRGGYREDLGHYVRSNWEANFARILQLQNKPYEYEPISFSLDETTTYTPDFKVDDTFFEIKGYITETAKKKLSLFQAKYPSVSLVIIGPEEYHRLRLEYSSKVFWEGR